MAKTVKSESHYVVTLTPDTYYRLHNYAQKHLREMSDELIKTSNKSLKGWSFEHDLKAWKQAVEGMACLEAFDYKTVETIVETPDKEAEVKA